MYDFGERSSEEEHSCATQASDVECHTAVFLLCTLMCFLASLSLRYSISPLVFR